MIAKPSIQRIKTFEDLVNSGIKFSGLLDTNPHFADQTIIGPLIVNGTRTFIYDKVPGFGLYLLKEMAEVLEFTAFDYDRMQPWYVVLDMEFYIGPEAYQLSWRNKKLEAFRFVQITLTEAGLTDLWTRQWQHHAQPNRHRRRLLEETRIDLNFEDMKLAWGALIIGLGFSTVILLGEIIMEKFKF